MGENDLSWLKLNPNGVVEIEIDTDRWVTLRRPKLRDLRDYGIMLEDADAKFRDIEKQIREDIGLGEEQAKWLSALQEGEAPEGTTKGEALIKAPQIVELQTRYIEALNRALYDIDANPYPLVWQKLIQGMSDSGDPDHQVAVRVDIEDMPTGMLASGPLTEVIQHFQTAPLIRGSQDGQPASATSRPGKTGKNARTGAAVATTR